MLKRFLSTGPALVRWPPADHVTSRHQQLPSPTAITTRCIFSHVHSSPAVSPVSNYPHSFIQWLTHSSRLRTKFRPRNSNCLASVLGENGLGKNSVDTRRVWGTYLQRANLMTWSRHLDNRHSSFTLRAICQSAHFANCSDWQIARRIDVIVVNRS